MEDTLSRHAGSKGPGIGVVDPYAELKHERTSRLVDLLSETAVQNGSAEDPRMKREVIQAILEWRSGAKMDGLKHQLATATVWVQRLVFILAGFLFLQTALLVYSLLSHG